MLSEKFYEVLKNEGIVTIVTWSNGEPHKEYDMMKSKFSFLTRVLEITVTSAEQML
jgi:hypothetical protein